MLKSTKHRPGWLVPYLLALDAMFYGRWEYWYQAVSCDSIPDEPIPKIRFDAATAYKKNEVQRNINACLDFAEFNTSNVLEKFADWILWGLGYKKNLSFPNITKEIDDNWYRTFNLGLFYTEPADHWAEVAQERGVGTGTGFFATPMPVVELMVQMTMGPEPRQEHKARSVIDPCCGTGSMLLSASNYSLNLYANDIHPLIHKMMLLNAYIYIPWMIHRPLSLTMFAKHNTGGERIKIPERLESLVCAECNNQSEFYTEVISDIKLNKNGAGFFEIDSLNIEEIINQKKGEFHCAQCKEKQHADFLPELR